MIRLAHRRTARWMAGLLALAAVELAACWSEHRTVAGPTANAPCTVPLTAQTAGAVVVFIKDYAFQSSAVHVARGSRVAWVNCGAPGDVAHTSTADNGAWTSGLIDPGAAYVTTFDKAGTFTYHCEPHPFMTGVIVVD